MSRFEQIQVVIHTIAIIALFGFASAFEQMDAGYLPELSLAAIILPLYGVFHVCRCISERAEEETRIYRGRVYRIRRG